MSTLIFFLKHTTDETIAAYLSMSEQEQQNWELDDLRKRKNEYQQHFKKELDNLDLEISHFQINVKDFIQSIEYVVKYNEREIEEKDEIYYKDLSFCEHKTDKSNAKEIGQKLKKFQEPLSLIKNKMLQPHQNQWYQNQSSCPIHNKPLEFFSSDENAVRRSQCIECRRPDDPNVKLLSIIFETHEKEHNKMRMRYQAGEDFFISLFKKPLRQIINILNQILSNFDGILSQLDEYWDTLLSELTKDDQLFKIKNAVDQENFAQWHYQLFKDQYSNQQQLIYEIQLKQYFNQKMQNNNNNFSFLNISLNIQSLIEEKFSQLQQIYNIMMKSCIAKEQQQQVTKSLIFNETYRDEVKNILFDENNTNFIFSKSQEIQFFSSQNNRFLVQGREDCRYEINKICFDRQARWLAIEVYKQDLKDFFLMFYAIRKKQQGVDLDLKFQIKVFKTIQLEADQKNGNCLSFDQDGIFIWKMQQNWVLLNRLPLNHFKLAQFDQGFNQLAVLSSDMLQIIICEKNEKLDQEQKKYNFQIQGIMDSENISQISFATLQDSSANNLILILNYKKAVVLIKVDLKTKSINYLKNFSFIEQTLNLLHFQNLISVQNIQQLRKLVLLRISRLQNYSKKLIQIQLIFWFAFFKKYARLPKCCIYWSRMNYYKHKLNIKTQILQIKVNNYLIMNQLSLMQQIELQKSDDDTLIGCNLHQKQIEFLILDANIKDRLGCSKCSENKRCISLEKAKDAYRDKFICDFSAQNENIQTFFNKFGIEINQQIVHHLEIISTSLKSLNELQVRQKEKSQNSKYLNSREELILFANYVLAQKENEKPIQMLQEYVNEKFDEFKQKSEDDLQKIELSALQIIKETSFLKQKWIQLNKNSDNDIYSINISGNQGFFISCEKCKKEEEKIEFCNSCYLKKKIIKCLTCQQIANTIKFCKECQQNTIQINLNEARKQLKYHDFYSEEIQYYQHLKESQKEILTSFNLMLSKIIRFIDPEDAIDKYMQNINIEEFAEEYVKIQKQEKSTMLCSYNIFSSQLQEIGNKIENNEWGSKNFLNLFNNISFSFRFKQYYQQQNKASFYEDYNTDQKQYFQFICLKEVQECFSLKNGNIIVRDSFGVNLSAKNDLQQKKKELKQETKESKQLNHSTKEFKLHQKKHYSQFKISPNSDWFVSYCINSENGNIFLEIWEKKSDSYELTQQIGTDEVMHLEIISDQGFISFLKNKFTIYNRNLNVITSEDLNNFQKASYNSEQCLLMITQDFNEKLFVYKLQNLDVPLKIEYSLKYITENIEYVNHLLLETLNSDLEKFLCTFQKGKLLVHKLNFKSKECRYISQEKFENQKIHFCNYANKFALVQTKDLFECLELYEIKKNQEFKDKLIFAKTQQIIIMGSFIEVNFFPFGKYILVSTKTIKGKYRNVIYKIELLVNCQSKIPLEFPIIKLELQE